MHHIAAWLEINQAIGPITVDIEHSSIVLIPNNHLNIGSKGRAGADLLAEIQTKGVTSPLLFKDLGLIAANSASDIRYPLKILQRRQLLRPRSPGSQNYQSCTTNSHCLFHRYYP